MPQEVFGELNNENTPYLSKETVEYLYFKKVNEFFFN